MSVGVYSKVGRHQISLPAGTYVFECWGGGGGGASRDDAPNISNWRAPCGRGGYAKGTINITATTTFYLYIGGEGYTPKSQAEITQNPLQPGITTRGHWPGGWNGGGTGNGSNNPSDIGNVRLGGGGATDIRVGGETLNHRIIVAGGGGGQPGLYGLGTNGWQAGGGNVRGGNNRSTQELLPEGARTQPDYINTTLSSSGEGATVNEAGRKGHLTRGGSSGAYTWTTSNANDYWDLPGFGQGQSRKVGSGHSTTVCGGGGGWFGGSSGNPAGAGSNFVRGLHTHTLCTAPSQYTFTNGVSAGVGDTDYLARAVLSLNNPLSEYNILECGLIRITAGSVPPTNPPTEDPDPGDPTVPPPPQKNDVFNFNFLGTNLTGVTFNGTNLTKVNYNGVEIFSMS